MELTPRYPDLTSLDFYLWEYLKNTVNATKLQTLEELRGQIEHAINDIPLVGTLKFRDSRNREKFQNSRKP